MSTRRQPAPLRALVDQFLKQAEADLIDRAAPAQLAPDFAAWVEALAEGGDMIAQAALDRMRLDGAERWLKEGIARRVGWLDPETGQALAGRTRAGTPMRDEQGARVGGFQQVMFRRMTRREFEDWAAMLRANRAALDASLAFARQVLHAWDRYPEAETVEAVCNLAGIELPPELRGEQAS
jgi:hypothetical protein